MCFECCDCVVRRRWSRKLGGGIAPNKLARTMLWKRPSTHRWAKMCPYCSLPEVQRKRKKGYFAPRSRLVFIVRASSRTRVDGLTAASWPSGWNAIDATRVYQTRPWVVSFSILSAFWRRIDASTGGKYSWTLQCAWASNGASPPCDSFPGMMDVGGLSNLRPTMSESKEVTVGKFCGGSD